MRIDRHLNLLLLAAALAAAGCAFSGSPPVSAPLESSEPVDSVYARRFALEAFDARLGDVLDFHRNGHAYLFRQARDSLLTDVNRYIRAHPHVESHRDFGAFLARLSALDTLDVDSVRVAPGQWAAVDDSLALSLADWPDLEVPLDPGLFPLSSTDFPRIRNQRVDFWIRYFTGPGRRRFAVAVERLQRVRPVLEPILRDLGLPPEILVVAMIESGLSTRAVSSARAVGPWQFIRATARLYGLRRNWWIDERRDLVASTWAAGHYLRDLHGIWNDWLLALAAYNCGEFRVARQIVRQRTENFWHLRLPRQTQMYVPKFLAALEILRDPTHYGFEIPLVEPLRIEDVRIDDATDLALIAEAAGCDLETLRELNPHLRRHATPPGMEVVVHVPAGRAERCRERLAAIPPDKRVTWVRHRVRRGETLSGIARAYGTSVAAIRRLNRLRSAHVIRAGQWLQVPARRRGRTRARVASAPRYHDPGRRIDRAALERHARRTAPPPGMRRLVYRVRPGDTVGEIAERYRTRASRIRRWNHLGRRQRIDVGQRLVLYVPASFDLPPPPDPVVLADPDTTCCELHRHRVRRGESLYAISRRYGVPLADLAAWNGKDVIRPLIRPGEILDVWLPRRRPR